jgi:hypothetical protein
VNPEECRSFLHQASGRIAENAEQCQQINWHIRMPSYIDGQLLATK